MLGHVFGVELRPQWVDIKEWIFSMVNLSRWHPVERLEALVPNGWKVHVGSLLGDFDTLESIEGISKSFK